ncbi:protein RALF-like 33-like, partial [Trifolium pratense]
MASSSSLTFIMIIITATTLLAMSFTPTAVAGGDHKFEMGLGWASLTKPLCKGGSIAECLGDEEFELDSEINRRILATTKYISYGAMKRNTVPCSRRGASYYNCRPGAQANPYSRGCSAITSSPVLIWRTLNNSK